MARMHSRRRGVSASKHPFRTESPDWVPLDNKEIEKLIVKLAKKGNSSARIGTLLRDQYGVPSVKLIIGRSMMQVLRENDLAPEIPEDMRNLMKKAVNLGEHLDKHPKDLHNKRNLHLIEAKIRRLVKYYQREGTIEKDWKYSLANAKLMVE